MTRIANRKNRMRWETNACYRGRPLVVSLDPHNINIRLKGKQSTYTVPFLAVYQTGARLYAMEQKRLKAEARKRRKQEQHD